MIGVIYYQNGEPERQAFMTSWFQHPAGIDNRLIYVKKGIGRSLYAFGKAARELDFEYMVFLNSNSEILADGWLAKLYNIAKLPEIGIAGCTASWESFRTNRRTFLNWRIPPFPNPHIRTNAFMMRRELMNQVWPKWLLTKGLEYLFENGQNSLTRQMENLCLESVVAGANGRAYDANLWRESNTFRTGNQGNLLVSDNQTRLFAGETEQRRAFLTKCAWG